MWLTCLEQSESVAVVSPSLGERLLFLSEFLQIMLIVFYQFWGICCRRGDVLAVNSDKNIMRRRLLTSDSRVRRSHFREKVLSWILPGNWWFLKSDKNQINRPLLLLFWNIFNRKSWPPVLSHCADRASSSYLSSSWSLATETEFWGLEIVLGTEVEMKGTWQEFTDKFDE